MPKIQKNNLVAQSNKLIEARYNLAEKDQLFVSSVFSLISPNDKKIPDFYFMREDLFKALGLHKDTASRELKKIAIRLVRQPLVIQNHNDEWQILSWFTYIKLRKYTVEVRINESLTPYLLSLSKRGHFTQYRLGSIAVLKGFYAMRMYPLLKKNYANKKYVFEVALDDFRKMMFGIDGSDCYINKYPVFKDLRRRVLESSKKQLEKKDPATGLYKSDLSFTFATRRTGRKISHLIFTIQKQATQPIKQSTNNKPKPNTAPAPQIILDYEFYGLDRLIVEPFLKQRGEQALINTLEKFKRDKERGAIQKNEQGYLRQLLKTNAGQATKSEKVDAKQKQQQAIAAEAQQQAQQRDELISQYKREFGESTRKRFLASLSNEQLEQIKNKLLQEHQGNSFVIERVRKGDLLSPYLIMSLNEWIPEFYQQEERYISEKLAEAENG